MLPGLLCKTNLYISQNICCLQVKSTKILIVVFSDSQFSFCGRLRCIFGQNQQYLNRWIIGRRCLQPRGLIHKPKKCHIKYRIMMVLLSIVHIVIHIHFCWWIFALISQQALLQMWLYFLCHNVSCARPMLMLSQLCGCQERSIVATDYLMTLYKQVKKNLLQWKQGGTSE